MFNSVSPTSDLIRVYLQEVGRYPLLTANQEVELAQQIQLMLHPPVGASVEELRFIQLQGRRAKDKMVRSNLRLVISVAKKYQKRDMEFLDLIQEGTIGLIRGVEKFDPARGYKLSTYCYWWIRQAITRAITEKSRTIRLPIHVSEKLNLFKKTRKELSHQLGRNPSSTEIAEAMKMTPEQLSVLLKAQERVTSTDVLVGVNRDTPLSEMLPSELLSPDELLLVQDDANYARQLLDYCTDQQRQIISLRFGLDGSTPLTWNQVGTRMGLSIEKVRQLQIAGFHRIRKKEETIK